MATKETGIVDINPVEKRTIMKPHKVGHVEIDVN